MRARSILPRSLPVIALLTSFACVDPPAESPVAETPAASHPEQALIDDLVLANRMLASEELDFLDAYGHVSVRSRIDPSHFFISRYVSPGIVTADGIIENDLDSKPVTGERSDQYGERFLHGELYRARPDVMAIVHSHTPELVAFSVSSVPLRSGDTVVPIFDIRKINNGRSGILSTPVLARSFAESIGDSNDDSASGPRCPGRRLFNPQRGQQREWPAHRCADPAATDFDGR